MEYNLKLKYSVEETLIFLKMQIREISDENNIVNINSILREIPLKITSYIDSIELIKEIESLSSYIENPFSEIKNEESIRAAKQRVLSYLNSINMYISREQVRLIDYRANIDVIIIQSVIL